jgi:cytochrome c peroxidase
VKNAGRSPQLDALAFYVATGVGTPRAPLAAEPAGTPLSQQIQRGRVLFGAANCASCHGGGGWASGRFNLLPATPTVSLDQGVAVQFDVLRDVGTFFATAPNELKANGTAAAGALGYNPPSLLGTFALAHRTCTTGRRDARRRDEAEEAPHVGPRGGRAGSVRRRGQARRHGAVPAIDRHEHRAVRHPGK